MGIAAGVRHRRARGQRVPFLDPGARGGRSSIAWPHAGDAAASSRGSDRNAITRSPSSSRTSSMWGLVAEVLLDVDLDRSPGNSGFLVAVLGRDWSMTRRARY